MANVTIKDGPGTTKYLKATGAGSDVDPYIPDHSISSIVPGVAATSLGKAEDTTHTTGDTGVFILGVRKDTPTSLAGTDGDYTGPLFDANGRLWGNVTVGVGATDLGKAEDTAHASGDTGVLMLGVRRDTPASTSGTDGDNTAPTFDANGRLWANGIVAGDVAHDGVDSGAPIKIGGKAETTTPAAVADGDRVDAWFDEVGRQIVRGDGTVAHDAADSGNPVKTGGKANAALPTAVTDADRVNTDHDLFGRPIVVAELSSRDLTRTSTVSADLSTPAAVSAAPGASKYLIVDELMISTVAAEVVTLTEETSGTVLGVVHTQAGGVSKVRLGKLPTSNKRLFAACATAGDIALIALTRAEA